MAHELEDSREYQTTLAGSLKGSLEGHHHVRKAQSSTRHSTIMYHQQMCSGFDATFLASCTASEEEEHSDSEAWRLSKFIEAL